MAEEQKFDISPEEEIRELELKLEAKKKELVERGEVMPSEKEVFRGVLKEHIEQARPALKEPGEPQVSGGAMPGLSPTLAQKADDLKEKQEREEHVRELIEIAMTHGIESAVKVAEAATPYLLDELHDHLVDDYYEKLVELRKIKEL